MRYRKNCVNYWLTKIESHSIKINSTLLFAFITVSSHQKGYLSLFYLEKDQSVYFLVNCLKSVSKISELQKLAKNTVQ